MKAWAVFPVLASHVLTAGLAWGQDPVPGRIQGRVLDHRGETPVSKAVVYLDAGPRAEIDATGTFTFEGVPPGVYGIAAVGVGCATAIGQVTVEPAGRIEVDFRLEIPGSEVGREAEEEATYPGQAGPGVQVMTGEEIRSSRASNLLELLRAKVPGVAGGVSASSDETGRLRVRGNSTATQASEPVLILDGARIQQRPGEVLSNLTPDQVSRIEIMRGSAGAWIYGPGSANGVIRVFTRSSDRPSGPSTDPEECGNPFRAGGGT